MYLVVAPFKGFVSLMSRALRVIMNDLNKMIR